MKWWIINTAMVMVLVYQVPAEAGDNPLTPGDSGIAATGPSGKKQVVILKPFNGILGANFAFTKEGRYGLVFLFNQGGKKHFVKFWYPHG